MFFKYVSNKEKQKENTDLLLNRRVNHSPTILNGMSFSKFLLCLYQHCWAPGLGNQPVQVGTKTNLPSEVKELMCETLQEPGPYTFMNPKYSYPRALQGG